MNPQTAKTTRVPGDEINPLKASTPIVYSSTIDEVDASQGIPAIITNQVTSAAISSQEISIAVENQIPPRNQLFPWNYSNPYYPYTPQSPLLTTNLFPQFIDATIINSQASPFIS